MDISFLANGPTVNNLSMVTNNNNNHNNNNNNYNNNCNNNMFGDLMNQGMNSSTGKNQYEYGGGMMTNQHQQHQLIDPASSFFDVMNVGSQHQHHHQQQPQQQNSMMNQQQQQQQAMLQAAAAQNAAMAAAAAAAAAGDRSQLLGKGGFAQNMILLPDHFVPGEWDVICGRGRKCFNHLGNMRFRELVAGYLERYSSATSKLDKSYILSDIVAQVRQHSPTGGFVKKDNSSGRWYEVGDFLAREKTSQAFRDALHEQYKSSNTYKKKRRQLERADKLERSHSQRSIQSNDSSVASGVSGVSSGVGSVITTNSGTGNSTQQQSQPDALLGSLDVSFGQLDVSRRKMLSAQKSSNMRNRLRALKNEHSANGGDDGNDDLVRMGGADDAGVGGAVGGATGDWFNKSCPNLANGSQTRGLARSRVSNNTPPIEIAHFELPDALKAGGSATPEFTTSTTISGSASVASAASASTATNTTNNNMNMSSNDNRNNFGPPTMISTTTPQPSSLLQQQLLPTPSAVLTTTQQQQQGRQSRMRFALRKSQSERRFSSTSLLSVEETQEDQYRLPQKLGTNSNNNSRRSSSRHRSLFDDNDDSSIMDDDEEDLFDFDVMADRFSSGKNGRSMNNSTSKIYMSSQDVSMEPSESASSPLSPLGKADSRDVLASLEQLTKDHYFGHGSNHDPFEPTPIRER